MFNLLAGIVFLKNVHYHKVIRIDGKLVGSNPLVPLAGDTGHIPLCCLGNEQGVVGGVAPKTPIVAPEEGKVHSSV